MLFYIALKLGNHSWFDFRTGVGPTLCWDFIDKEEVEDFIQL